MIDIETDKETPSLNHHGKEGDAEDRVGERRGRAAITNQEGIISTV